MHNASHIGSLAQSVPFQCQTAGKCTKTRAVTILLVPVQWGNVEDTYLGGKLVEKCIFEVVVKWSRFGCNGTVTLYSWMTLHTPQNTIETIANVSQLEEAHRVSNVSSSKSNLVVFWHVQSAYISTVVAYFQNGCCSWSRDWASTSTN